MLGERNQLREKHVQRPRTGKGPEVTKEAKQRLVGAQGARKKYGRTEIWESDHGQKGI